MPNQHPALQLPASMANQLRCPHCHASLTLGATAVTCRSSSCGRQYAILNGVPVLIDEDQSLFSTATALRASHKASPQPRIKAMLERFLPTLERNVHAVRNAAAFQQHLFRSCGKPLVLNIGGKHAGAACAGLRSHTSATVVEMDVRASKSTNLIADPLAIPFESETFDAVIIDAVLEHVTDPARAVSEIWRVLKTDGLVYSDVPFMLQVHGGALDFCRFSHVGHRRLFRSFTEVQSGMSQGPSVALATAMLGFLLSFVRGKPARYAVRTLCRLGLFWLKYIDIFLSEKAGAMDSAMGTYFIGRKSIPPISDRELLETYRGASPDLHPVR